MLCSEQILTLSDQVGVLANRAYAIAPELAADLQGVLAGLRGLYEAVSEIEPSRVELRRVEERLYRYPALVDMLARGRSEWWDRAFWADCPSGGHQDDVRVQGGATVALAQRIAEVKDELERKVSEELAEALSEVNIIEEALRQLPRKLETLVKMRYFEGRCWYDIAEEIGCVRSHCYRLRDEALTLIARSLEM